MNKQKTNFTPISMAASTNSNSINNPTNTSNYNEAKFLFTRFVITAGLPFNLGETDSTIELFNFLNPNFGKITENELLQEASEQLTTIKKEIILTFSSLGKNIALACDVWRSEHIGRNFLRVTANWIDSDWVMQKRVLDFVWLDIDEIVNDSLECVKKCMVSWGISDKVFSFTFDDVTNDNVVVEGLKGVVRPVLDGRLFSSDCVVRVLNACVENAWEVVKGQVDMIWRGVCMIRSKFEPFCERYGYEPKPTIFYVENEWDTVRELLRTFIPYKDAVSEYVASFPWNVAPDEAEARDSDDDTEPYVPVVISERHWEVASLFCRILDVFYVAVADISGNYKPSSCVVLRHLVNVAKLFSELKESALFNEKFSGMKEIFLKNFGKIPEIYCVAAVMDPRVKLSGCECLLEAFYKYTDSVTVNVAEEMKGVSDLLHKMYNLHAVQSTKVQCASHDPANNDHSWSLISGKREEMVDSAFEELVIYMQTPPLHKPGSEKFDILAWWKENEKSFPVLSSMARDLLTIPASTLSPDCAFFLNKDKLILDEMALKMSESDCVIFDEWRWDMLDSDTNDLVEGAGDLWKQKLELCICLKDWLNAANRTQGKREPEYDERLGPDPGEEEEGSGSDNPDPRDEDEGSGSDN